MVSGAEAIKIVGSQLVERTTDQFDIMTEPRRTIYKNIYSTFQRRLSPNNREKSIFIIGTKGVGKSICMKVMQRLFKDTDARFVYKSGSELVDMLEDFKPAQIKEWYGKGLKCDLYIDDIGLGTAITKNWGNAKNIIAELLFERSELFVTAGFKTHLSSNLPTTVDKLQHPTVKTLEDMYGDRVLDRIYEMSEIISWTGDSLRGKK